MPAVARLGDPGSHGGAIVTASADTDCDGIAVARKGDTYACPLHGPNPIVTGSPTTDVNSRAIARVGDATACGAVIVSGSPTWSVD